MRAGLLALLIGCDAPPDLGADTGLDAEETGADDPLDEPGAQALEREAEPRPLTEEELAEHEDRLARTSYYVDYTRDACDRSRTVYVYDAWATRFGCAASSAASVPLGYMTTEFDGYCGSTRERSVNDLPFNRVTCTRSSTGAITWTFYQDS